MSWCCLWQELPSKCKLTWTADTDLLYFNSTNVTNACIALEHGKQSIRSKKEHNATGLWLRLGLDNMMCFPVNQTPPIGPPPLAAASATTLNIHSSFTAIPLSFMCFNIFGGNICNASVQLLGSMVITLPSLGWPTPQLGKAQLVAGSLPCVPVVTNFHCNNFFNRASSGCATFKRNNLALPRSNKDCSTNAARPRTRHACKALCRVPVMARNKESVASSFSSSFLVAGRHKTQSCTVSPFLMVLSFKDASMAHVEAMSTMIKRWRSVAVVSVSVSGCRSVAMCLR